MQLQWDREAAAESRSRSQVVSLPSEASRTASPCSGSRVTSLVGRGCDGCKHLGRYEPEPGPIRVRMIRNGPIRYPKEKNSTSRFGSRARGRDPLSQLRLGYNPETAFRFLCDTRGSQILFVGFISSSFPCPNPKEKGEARSDPAIFHSHRRQPDALTQKIRRPCPRPADTATV
ncbi:unnamed protein product [Musa textilis]